MEIFTHSVFTQNSKNIKLKEFSLQPMKIIISKYDNQKWISVRETSIDSAKAVQRKCHECYHTTSREKSVKYTRYQCEECDVELCIIDYFEAYHTLKYFLIA